MKTADDVEIIRPRPLQRVACVLVVGMIVVAVLAVPSVMFTEPAGAGVLFVVRAAVSACLRASHDFTLELRIDDYGVTLRSLLGHSSVSWQETVRELRCGEPRERLHAIVVACGCLVAIVAYLMFWGPQGPTGQVAVAAWTATPIASAWGLAAGGALAWGDRRLWPHSPVASRVVLTDAAGGRVHVPLAFRADELAPLHEAVRGRAPRITRAAAERAPS